MDFNVVGCSFRIKDRIVDTELLKITDVTVELRNNELIFSSQGDNESITFFEEIALRFKSSISNIPLLESFGMYFYSTNTVGDDIILYCESDGKIEGFPFTITPEIKTFFDNNKDKYFVIEAGEALGVYILTAQSSVSDISMKAYLVH